MMRSCWLLLKQSICNEEIAGLVSDVSVIACKGKKQLHAYTLNYAMIPDRSILIVLICIMRRRMFFIT